MATTAGEKDIPAPYEGQQPHRHLDPNIPAEAHAWVDSLGLEEYQRAQTKLKRKVSSGRSGPGDPGRRGQ